MKTSNLGQVEKPIGRDRHNSLENMEAIAYGVKARFEEDNNYSNKVTDATVNIARTIRVSEKLIERWKAYRLTQLAHDTKKFRELKSLLEKL